MANLYNTAPMGGFPAKKPVLPQQDASTGGPGLPPPVPPATPNVPAIALHAGNGFGTQMPSLMASQTTQMESQAGSSPLDPMAGEAGTQAPPASPTGTAATPLPSPLQPMPTGWGQTMASDGAGTASGVPVGSAAAPIGMVAPPPSPTGTATTPTATAPTDTVTPYTGPTASAVAPPAITPTPVDWNAQAARTSTSATQSAQAPPPTTPPVTKPPVTPGSPKPGDPGYSPVLDPNSPDYDPTLAAQLAAQKAGAGANPPATDGAGGTSGGNAGTGGNPAASAGPGSTNLGDYPAPTTSVDPKLAQWNDQYQSWLTGNMANSSPYSTDLIKQGQQVLQDSIDRQTKAGDLQLENYFASRGLTGSSLEGQAMKDFQAQMNEQQRQGNFNLGQAQVQAQLQQEATVGSLASQFMSNMTDQQRTQLGAMEAQMSASLQKYGIDKQSADAAANRQMNLEIVKENLIGQYGGSPSADNWDLFNKLYPGQAEQYFGPRPGGAATSTTTTTNPNGTGPATGGTNQYPSGTQPNTAPSDNPAMNSDVYNYQGINAKIPETLPMRQRTYDTFVSKWGAAAATKNLGPRPTK